MSVIQNLASGLVRSFSSPADLISGKGLGRLGRLVAGSGLASANMAAETFHLGARAAAETLGSAAAAGRGQVPGAGWVHQLARTVDDESTRAADSARRLATESLELMADEPAEGAESGDGGTAGQSWIELAADTAMGPLASVVETTVALSADTIRSAAGSLPGRLVLDAALDRMTASSSPALFDSGDRRQSFVALATDSCAAAIRQTYALAEAAVRLAFSDTRQMHRKIEAGLEEMRQLVASAEMQDLLPASMVSESLQERARLVVDRAPERFLAALDNGTNGQPRLAAILRATLEDADNLRVFIAVYPQVVTLVGTDVGKLLVAGSISFSEMEAFMEGRRLGSESCSSS